MRCDQCLILIIPKEQTDENNIILSLINIRLESW